MQSGPTQVQPSQPGAGSRRSGRRTKPDLADALQRIADLEAQLALTAGQLEAVLQDYEAASEELLSAHDELHAANEELQFSNQELAQERQKLQSKLDDISRQNHTLHRRVRELTTIRDELIQLLNGIEIPALLLGTDCTVRHFTAAATSVWNLLPSDIGRSISQLQPKLELPPLELLCRKALEEFETQLAPVCSVEGRALNLVVRTVAGPEHRIDGIAVTLLPMDSGASPFQPAVEPVRINEVVESVLPRVKAALEIDTPVEISLSTVGPASPANRRLLESVIVRSAVAAQQSIYGPTQVRLASYELEADTSYSESHPTVPPGKYVTLSIAAKPLPARGAPPRIGAWRLPGVQLPEMAIRELGGFCWAAAGLAAGTEINIYLPRS